MRRVDAATNAELRAAGHEGTTNLTHRLKALARVEKKQEGAALRPPPPPPEIPIESRQTMLRKLTDAVSSCLSVCSPYVQCCAETVAEKLEAECFAGGRGSDPIYKGNVGTKMRALRDGSLDFVQYLPEAAAELRGLFHTSLSQCYSSPYTQTWQQQ